MKTTKKPSILLLIALIGFPQLSETIYTPAMPAVAKGLATTASWVEATLAIYFLGFALGVMVWGWISDIYGRRPSMLTGLLIYGFATYACAHSTNVESLLLWRFIQAFGASVGSVVTQTILRDLYTGQERTQKFSIISGALAFSPAIGPILGGMLSELFSWRANFSLLVLLAILLLLWTFLTLNETRPQQSPQQKVLTDMLKSTTLWGHLLLIGATNGILFGFYQEAPFLFINQMGLSPFQYGFFGLMIASATLVSAQVCYKYSTHTLTLIKLGVGCIIGSSLLLSALSFHLVGMSSLLFLTFFGVGLILPNSLSHALKPYQHAAGRAGSIFGGGYYILIALFTGMISMLHSIVSLPIEILALGMLLAFATYLIHPQKKSITHFF